MAHVLVVLPARFASTRFPGKPLADRTGWPLIRHAYEQARQSRLATRVLVATDDERIAHAVRAFGGEVELTRADHPSGTDRVAEVAGRHPEADLLVNVQGDEPELDPAHVDVLAELALSTDADMATLATPFARQPASGSGSPTDPNCVKVVLGQNITCSSSDSVMRAGYALYFSRSLVPFPRDAAGVVADASQYLLHVGAYAYRPGFVRQFAAWPAGALEQVEKLEQLRVLEHGGRIAVGVVADAHPGVDTPADYDAFVRRWETRHNRS